MQLNIKAWWRLQKAAHAALMGKRPKPCTPFLQQRPAEYSDYLPSSTSAFIHGGPWEVTLHEEFGGEIFTQAATLNEINPELEKAWVNRDQS
jgi:hypothetical protein